MSWLKLILIGGALLPLAGCMTAGTNMHGDFACRAPNGTCAPMSTIDARAVASMGAGVRPVGDTMMPGIPGGGRVVIASADGTPPGRTSDRVLRVVFPAHIDAAGIYHDEATAHAVVERAGLDRWPDRRRARCAGRCGRRRRPGQGTLLLLLRLTRSPAASSPRWTRSLPREPRMA